MPDPDGGAMLRAAMAGYPDAMDPVVEALLAALPWRYRRAVELVYGEGRTQEQAAAELCVSRWTVMRDLREAGMRFRRAGRSGRMRREE